MEAYRKRTTCTHERNGWLVIITYFIKLLSLIFSNLRFLTKNNISFIWIITKVIVFLLNKILTAMRTTRNKQGTWQADVQPSSLIINFFAVTDIIGENTDKVSCLLKNIKKEISFLAFGIKKSNIITVSDHGMEWLFDVTIDANGNHGLLFTGLK